MQVQMIRSCASQKIDNFECLVAYSGRALKKSEKNYTISELEALAVINAF